MEYLTIDDLKNEARKKVPKAFHDYVLSGSWTESTLKDNSNDFKKISFRQRVAVDISNRSTRKSLLGTDYKMPVALAPVGLLGMQKANGEILAAQAAESFGVPFTLSTMSICSIEEVARNTSKPFWFQLYVMRDHDFAKRLVERAKAAECSALVLTLDLQILGQRHADIRNGLSVPIKIKMSNVFDLISKPNWCFEMARSKNRTFGNIMGHVKDIKNQKWWLNSSKNINVELPSDGFCAVTPMFLNTKICKDLDQKYDLEELIYKHNCTEYSLYWLYGLKKGINWSEMYSFGNLLNVAIWYKVDNSTEKTFQYFEDLLVKSKLVEPKMGLMQSNINFEESTDQIINKIIELLNIHKR